MSRLRWLRRIALDLPRNLELTYCLLRDPRVPIARKGALMAAFAFIVSPIDLPVWVPLVGEADILVLTLLATGLFVDTAPAELVEEHRHAIAGRQSIFDRDVENGRRIAVMLAGRVRERPPGGDVHSHAVEHAAFDHHQSGVPS